MNPIAHIKITVTVLVAFLAIIAFAEAADRPLGISGQPILVPNAVRLFVHHEVQERAFLDPLLKQLRRRLAAPVVVKDSDFDLDPFKPTWGRMDIEPVIESFAQKHHRPSSPNRTIDFLIITRDMRAWEARYLFAAALGNETTFARVGVVSLSRLQETGFFSSRDQNPELTAERVYKMILKNTAKMAGYVKGSGCLFGFPRSLSELDALPISFCNRDKEALQTAGLLRMHPR